MLLVGLTATAAKWIYVEDTPDSTLGDSVRPWMTGDKPTGFGSTKERTANQKLNYDADLAKKIIAWFNSVCQLGEDKYLVNMNEDYSWENAFEKLRDGKLILCAANRVKPTKSKKIKPGPNRFSLMANTGNFLAIASAMGVSETDMFQTAALFDGTDLKKVINGMDAFARKTIKMSIVDIPTYAGPVEADKNERKFTHEQQTAGNNVVGLQMGKNQGAYAAGVNFDGKRAI